MILSKCSLIFVYNKFLHVIHDHREYRENQDAGINCKQDWAVFYFINNLFYHHWQPKKRKERFILLWSTGHTKTILKNYFPINTWCPNCLGCPNYWHCLGITIIRHKMESSVATTGLEYSKMWHVIVRAAKSVIEARNEDLNHLWFQCL